MRSRRYPAKLTERLEHWAGAAPDRVFLAQRDATRRLAQAHLCARRWTAARSHRRGAAATRALARAADRDPVRQRHRARAHRPRRHVCRHPLCAGLAGLFADLAGFRQAQPSSSLLTPGLVFAADGDALRARDRGGRAGRTSRSSSAADPIARPRRPLCSQTLLTPQPTRRSTRRTPRVGRDTIAKFLFTSGSTGTPKGVINTQRMWCANQAMIRSQLAFFADEPPVIVDWSPWHHTAGGNHNFGFVLYNGGTFYIDEGKPVPGAIETTVQQPARGRADWYFTCRRATRRCCPICAADAQLRKHFLQPPQGALFRRRRRSSQHRCSTRCRSLRSQRCGERIIVPDRPRLDRDRAAWRSRACGRASACQQYGPAGAGRGAQARAERRQARGAAARAEHHAGLLAPAGAHRGGLRRGRLLQARRRAANSRTPTIRRRACCSTAASPRTSSSPPAPG